MKLFISNNKFQIYLQIHQHYYTNILLLYKFLIYSQNLNEKLDEIKHHCTKGINKISIDEVINTDTIMS